MIPRFRHRASTSPVGKLLACWRGASTLSPSSDEKVREALVRPSWSHLPAPADGPEKPRIAVAMSGGVDSSVAAYILKEQGCDVFGIYMKTWDELEEGESGCTVAEDRTFARKACAHLSIPFVEVDLVAEYWQSVFQPYIERFGAGQTPNPDLYCNEFMKFGALMKRAKELGATGLATGHFARLGYCESRKQVRLVRGLDKRKDQTYFLSRLNQDQLGSTVFPVGALTKDQVRGLADSIGLPNAGKKSSTGICFIGKRRFSNFLKQYIYPTPGEFVAVDGSSMGTHEGLELYTRGQRSRIESGGRGAFYVVGKDVDKGVVYVAENRDHPSQFSRGAFLKELHWIGFSPPGAYARTGRLRCEFKARYLEQDGKCTLYSPKTPVEDEPTKFYHSGSQETDVIGPLHYVKFDEPHAAVTPEQALVLYDGDVCLGSALIHRPGKTLFEEEEERDCLLP
ncbi:tRNA-specific 2-thiouridylase MnmA [Chloropicon primus]|uniref:tRNA-5-taurinomethyluridine 2-sulfurtransferase n=1 Tax=Chloropicon primus TaxID=1764295 RepID=A0A5B8MB40_9CHLO|nr:tRNA-specific 2-thiouridylase MnmA [Chloropicon primus]UPQ96795.1 tRNA-specific 2-thiouridylase MnmA [Chloropicon primus]|mmetsp:Transcript_6440/g.19055  ORF Transcript_6440/g.19055 Transcript_6440/m.19055 type:complete len:454 (-) Transcript_6440:42-1403(-)|eukprot:QDZ17577.1 tRNA-specific 2-thiouridylase MnmA [Chloropicon primus]